VKDKQKKRTLLAERGQADFSAWMAEHGITSAADVGAL